MFILILVFLDYNSDAYIIVNKMAVELGLHLIYLRCFLLIFVPYAQLVPCGSGVFCFFEQRVSADC